MSTDFKQAAIGGGIALALVGVIGIITQAPRLRPTPPPHPYLYLSVDGCEKSFEAIFKDGALSDGWWVLSVASGSPPIQIKPAANCTQVFQPLPAKYNGGEKFRWTTQATGSAKK